MTKEELQQELLKKVKEGIKPSKLRKLKKSKSEGELRSSLNNPPSPLLQDQLKEKQKEIEQLRKQLEKANSELKSTQEELDKSLEARIQGIKTFGKEHDKRTKAQQELKETIEEASNELVSSDKNLSSLRTKLFKTEQEKTKLSQDLSLAQRLVELRREPLEPSWPAFPGLSWLVWTLTFVALWIWIKPKPNYDL